MIKMKKIITLVMVILMLMNIAVIAQADEAVSEPVKEISLYQDSIDKLQALGFLELEEGEDFYPDNKMTRAEFIVLAMKIIGATGAAAAVSAENTFIDVRDDLWYDPYIGYALEIGVLSKNSQGYFRPDEQITANEALKIMVAAMGYDLNAQQRGGYPQGYLTVAYELNMVNGIQLSGTDALSRGQAVKILDNCLDQDVMVVESIYGQNTTFQKESLLKRHNMYSGKGVITANAATALDRASKLGENQVELDDGLICNSGKTAAQKYLGYLVEYVYQDDDGDRTLLYVKAHKNNREVMIQAKDIASAGSGYIKVQPDKEPAKNYTISSNAYILYNGCYIERFSEDMMMPAQGSVKLLANDGGAFNIVFIESYTNIYVGGKSQEDGIIYDKYDSENEVCLSADDSDLMCEIRNTDGEELSFDDIVIGDVVSVYKSMGENYVRVVVSKNTAQGTVTGITQNKQITMDGKSYEITKQFYQYMSDEAYGVGMIHAGMSVTICLDADGYVAAYEMTVNTTRKLAYMKGASVVGENEDEVLVKLFTAEGNHEKYLCAERVKIDGDSFKEYDKIYKALCEHRNYVVSKPITYTLNEKNEIIYIDTPAKGVNEEDGTLFQTHAGYVYNEETQTYESGDAFLTYKNKMMSFGMQILVKETTPIFVVPQNDAENAGENYFSIKDISEIQNDEKVYCNSFQLNRDSYYADLLIQYSNTAATTTIDNNSNLAVVKEINHAVYEDKPCLQITAITGGKEIVLYPKDEDTFENIKGRNAEKIYKNFRVGDVFRYRKLADGTVGTVEMLIGTEGERLGNGSAAKETAYNEESNKFAQMRFAVRNVYGKKDSIIRLTPEDPAAVPDSSIYSLEVQKASSYQIIVVNTKGRAAEVRKGTANDIRDYRACGGSFSSVLVQTRFGDARTIVVFDQKINQ